MSCSECDGQTVSFVIPPFRAVYSFPVLSPVLLVPENINLIQALIWRWMIWRI